MKHGDIYIEKHDGIIIIHKIISEVNLYVIATETIVLLRETGRVGICYNGSLATTYENFTHTCVACEKSVWKNFYRLCGVYKNWVSYLTTAILGNKKKDGEVEAFYDKKFRSLTLCTEKRGGVLLYKKEAVKLPFSKIITKSKWFFLMRQYCLFYKEIDNIIKTI